MNIGEAILKVPLTDLFANIAAGIGIIGTPSLALADTDNAFNLEEMDEHGGPIPFVCCNSQKNFFQSGVQRQSKSWTGHAGIYVGERNAKLIRLKHPDLLKERKAAGLITDHDITLPAVPAEVKPDEVVESKATVAIDSWSDAVGEGIQAVAFIRDWDDSQTDRILYHLYQHYGAAYDVFEIARDTGLWLIPKFNQVHVCSSLVAHALKEGDAEIEPWMKNHNVDIDECFPAHVGRYLFENPTYKPLAFRCDLNEAKKKI